MSKFNDFLKEELTPTFMTDYKGDKIDNCCSLYMDKNHKYFNLLKEMYYLKDEIDVTINNETFSIFNFNEILDDDNIGVDWCIFYFVKTGEKNE